MIAARGAGSRVDSVSRRDMRRERGTGRNRTGELDSGPGIRAVYEFCLTKLLLYTLLQIP